MMMMMMMMIHSKLHLISPGCPQPSTALQVQNYGLNTIHLYYIYIYITYYMFVHVKGLHHLYYHKLCSDEILNIIAHIDTFMT